MIDPLPVSALAHDPASTGAQWSSDQALGLEDLRSVVRCGHRIQDKSAQRFEDGAFPSSASVCP